jgi:NAD+-dependent secondary alcohol dehydrogenase Adh1
MKAAVLHRYDESLDVSDFVVYEEVPAPQIEKPADVIVRIGGAGVCRTDLHVVEGLWRERVPVKLPYIMGHENAGWVDAIGSGVSSVKVGDPVICHPLASAGHSLEARRGNDMHSGDASFPGIDSNGGYAELLKTTERSLVKLPSALSPKDVAPYADAGLSAYHAAKKASRNLLPGDFAVVIGAGGLGHIGIQVIKSLCSATIIVVDRSSIALELARECGADKTIQSGDDDVEKVSSITGGKGAIAVLDFVGEGNAVHKGLAMTANAGSYYVIGYGGKIEIPTMDLITTEKSIIGNLVGTYSDLVELMALADRGLVKLATREYRLSQANQALKDLHAGKIKGRAVLLP